MREPHLAEVRRLEAIGFRSWPASTIVYDGTWLIRLTGEFPSKRLNSINPLDPGDSAAFEERIERASRRFVAFARPLVFRLSPLAGSALVDYLDAENWTGFDESCVMERSLEAGEWNQPQARLLTGPNAFVDAARCVHGLDPVREKGLRAIVRAIEPETGLFVSKNENEPVATALCVLDGEMAGLLEVATRPGDRRKGHGRHIVAAALDWARSRGARRAWLQVTAANQAALSLYRSLGFLECYRYHYRIAPGEHRGA